MNSMYEYLLKDNVKLMKAIFLEKQKNDVERVVELLRQFNDNNREMDRIKHRIGGVV